jgi:S1-C subfamily serine protease
MRFKVISATGIGLMSVSLSVHSNLGSVKPASQIAHDAFPSVVLLTMQDAGGQPISLGSGFFVERDVVATNFHVINRASAGYAKVVDQPAKLNIKGVVGLDPAHDLALLQLEESTTSSLSVAPKFAGNVGDTVFAIGSPRGLEGTFSQGIVSSVREFGSDRVLQITAPISPGSSGGPVLDQTGTVVGVSVATIENGQNLNFAIPSDYLGALQKQKIELQPLRALAQAKDRTTLLDRLRKQPAESGVTGTHFLRVANPDTDSWNGRFSYSLQNDLQQSVKDVVGLIVFYSSEGEAIDFVPIEYKGVIPPRLAKHITGQVDPTVIGLNCPQPWEIGQKGKKSRPVGKVEFRILDFSVVND